MRRGRGRGISAGAFALALLCASIWWSAWSTMLVLHDDAHFSAALTRYLDRPEVRSEVARWTTRALDQATPRTGANAAQRSFGRQLTRALTAKVAVAPMTDTVVKAALAVRDSTVSQLDAKVIPKRAVTADVAPLLKVAKVQVPAQLARQLGARSTKGALTLPVLSAAQVQQLQGRYNVLAGISRWLGWVALALLGVAVATSARPLLTVAIAGAAAVLVALLAPIALAGLAGGVAATACWHGCSRCWPRRVAAPSSSASGSRSLAPWSRWPPVWGTMCGGHAAGR